MAGQKLFQIINKCYLIVTLSLVTPLLATGEFTGSCSTGNVTFARKPKIGLSSEYKPIAEVIQVHESPPSECFSKCSNDSECYGYILNHQNSSCLLIMKGLIKELYFVHSEVSSYHWKICLSTRPDNDMANKCSRQEWAYDVFSELQLSRYDDKEVPAVTSIEHCMELCSTESTFACRSSSYRPSSGRCILSRHDRRTAPEVFRKSAKDMNANIYMERQCVEEPSGCQFGARSSRYSLSFSRQHVQVLDGVSSREQCEQACLGWEPFPCRSYQFTPSPAACVISPEDTNSIIGAEPEASQADESSSVFEKESCVESAVRCGATSMTVIVKVSTPFRGRLYAVGYPYDCYSVTVSTEGEITLDLQLHGRRCGTRNLGNGTFMNNVVVQHHPFVLRTTDRRIEVACDYQEMSRVKIKGSKGIRHTDVSDSEFRPMSQHTVTAVAPTPPIRLRVVNASDQDVSGAELGDPLFLKVELADDSVYGIFGSDLVARSSAGSETVLLIDDNGCPVEPTVISSLEKLPGSKSLVAPFQAFKFASDAAVKFQLTVSYCLDACPPVDCESASSKKNSQRSYGRRKRAATGRFTELQAGDVISDVQAETAYLVVKNIGPSGQTDQTHRLVQPQFFQESPEGQVRIRAASNVFCVDSGTVYLTALVAGIVQLAIIGACATLFFCTGSGKCDASSWTSVKTMKKLMPNRT